MSSSGNPNSRSRGRLILLENENRRDRVLLLDGLERRVYELLVEGCDLRVCEDRVESWDRMEFRIDGRGEREELLLRRWETRRRRELRGDRRGDMGLLFSSASSGNDGVVSTVIPRRGRDDPEAVSEATWRW